MEKSGYSSLTGHFSLTLTLATNSCVTLPKSEVKQQNSACNPNKNKTEHPQGSEAAAQGEGQTFGVFP